MDAALDHLYTQVVEFSHHVNDLELTDLLVRCWGQAHFMVTGCEDDAGVRHMVIHVMENLARDPGYVCIHEDSLSEGEALSMGHSHWRLVRGACGAQGGQSRGRSDGDYSPSKPLAKAHRMAKTASTSAGYQ